MNISIKGLFWEGWCYI